MIDDKTIYCKLMGQMGNQMFQIATVIAHALKNNKQYVLPQRSGKRDQFPMMFPHLPTLHEYPLPENGFYREQKFGRYFEIPSSANYLVGYFQSSKYFSQYLLQIKAAFQIPSYERRRSESISIHIRRGDALQNDRLNQPSKKYYDDALSIFPDYFKVEVFSDDIEWCRDQFKGDRFVFNPKQNNPLITLSNMIACEHHIIANSTFSWWGAYLDLNTHILGGNTSKVISPSKHTWFNERYREQLTAEDIVEPHWIQIDI